MNESREADAIRERMEEVRRDLGTDVHQLVENVRVRSDWRYYFHKYPWVILGAATAVGYLVVPRRPPVYPELKSFTELLRQPSRIVQAVQPAPPPLKPPTLVDKVVSAGTSAIMRGVLAFATQQAGKMFSPPQSTRMPGNGHHGDHYGEE